MGFDLYGINPKIEKDYPPRYNEILEEYGKDADNIHKRVEQGEKIAVTDGEVSVVLTPSDEYVRMHTTGGSAES